MKSTCCRSTPRCAGCPVLARRAQIDATGRRATARLVDEVLSGSGVRAYPPSVQAALRDLELARAAPKLTGTAA